MAQGKGDWLEADGPSRGPLGDGVSLWESQSLNGGRQANQGKYEEQDKGAKGIGDLAMMLASMMGKQDEVADSMSKMWQQAETERKHLGQLDRRWYRRGRAKTMNARAHAQVETLEPHVRRACLRRCRLRVRPRRPKLRI